MKLRLLPHSLVVVVSLSIAVSACAQQTVTTASASQELCVDVSVYGGINAIPPITSQIYPSSTGRDTVVNDMACPLGTGPVVVIGSWEHAADYTPKPGENPCAGEPGMKIAYPTALTGDACYCWKHWVSKDDLHPNSAKAMTCGADRLTFSYTQWTDLVCGKSGMAEVPAGVRKTLYTNKCCRDIPPVIWSQILNYSGCAPR